MHSRLFSLDNRRKWRRCGFQHCSRRGLREDFSDRSRGEGTINSQIVKQESEYTPRVSDTVTHVLLRTHSRRTDDVPSLKFYRGTNPTKTIIKLGALQPLELREVRRRGAEKLITEGTGIAACLLPASPKLETALVCTLIALTSAIRLGEASFHRCVAIRLIKSYKLIIKP